jgi:hypothetical protein
VVDEYGGSKWVSSQEYNERSWGYGKPVFEHSSPLLVSEKAEPII